MGWQRQEKIRLQKEVQGYMIANRGSGIEPRVQACLDIGISVGIQGLPGDSRPLQLGNSVLVYISRSSKMIYTASPCSSVPRDHTGGTAPSLHTAHP